MNQFKIIVPIVAKTPEGAKGQIMDAGGDAVEIRIDAMDGATDENFKAFTTMGKTVMTDRKTDESGYKAQTDRNRYNALNDAIAARPWAVDIEFRSPKMFRKRLTKAAHKYGVRTISSFHNFKKTPPFATLSRQVDAMLAEADYAKIACMPQKPEDITALLRLVALRPGRVTSFALGEKAAFSRILSLRLGAPFGYARGVQSTAPGQYKVDEMRHALDSFNEDPYWLDIQKRWDFDRLKNPTPEG